MSLGPVCWSCSNVATHALQQKCCGSQTPLCGKHATAMKNTMKLLANTVSASDPMRCTNCYTDIAQADRLGEVVRL
jgi:hypothetical protein